MKVTDLIFRGGGLKPDEVIKGSELFHIMPGEQRDRFELDKKTGFGYNISTAEAKGSFAISLYAFFSDYLRKLKSQ